MSLHVFFFFNPLQLFKKHYVSVILFIQNVVLRANYTLNYAFNWFSFARQGPLVPIHYTTTRFHNAARQSNAACAISLWKYY